MAIAFFPFKYYAFLPDSTLTTRIREESWNLDKLFPLFRETKSELEKLKKGIKSNIEDLPKLNHPIALLASEIKTGLKDLKLINFYDSTVLYLYYKLLRHVFDLCEKEQSRLAAEKEKNLSKEIKLKDVKLEEIKKAKDEIERKIEEYEKRSGGLIEGEHELIKVYNALVKRMGKMRWSAEKQAQHEFDFHKLTWRGMESINRKLKVAAIKAKKTVPQKALLMQKINRGKIEPKDVVMLAKLVSGAIDSIIKDTDYSSKLIAKFENEFKRLNLIVESLKKEINKNKRISSGTAKNITQPWGDAIKYLEEESQKDLMHIFRNIFVEYKYVATRKIE